MQFALAKSAQSYRGTAIRFLAYLGVMGGLALAAVELIPSTAGVAAVAPAPRPDWVEMARPNPAFTLTLAEFGDADFRYALRRHAQGGRRDVLSFGELAGPAPQLMVEIYRPGAEHAGFADPASEIAARAALGPSPRMTPAGSLESKLGSFSLVEFTVKTAGDARRCLGFVRNFAEPLLQIAGWYCRTGPGPVDRGVVDCALDRLTLLTAGSDGRVADLFARADLKRKYCTRSTPVAAFPPRGTWIEAEQDPKLRGRLAAQ